MRRYWVAKEKVSETSVLLDGDTFHHIVEVCRTPEGEPFEVLWGEGIALTVKISERLKRQATAQILSRRSIEPLKTPHLVLALSLPRYPTMDTIVEKAVELGVFEVHPFVSDFSFARSLKDISTAKIERWDKIVKAATQQSGRADLMKVQAPVTLEDLLARFNRKSNSLGLFCFEGAGEIGLKAALAPIKQSETPKEIWFFVGSEGGFSPAEVDKFKQRQLQPITLGSQVLRVETACLALAAVIKYECDLMQ